MAIRRFRLSIPVVLLVCAVFLTSAPCPAQPQLHPVTAFPATLSELEPGYAMCPILHASVNELTVVGRDGRIGVLPAEGSDKDARMLASDAFGYENVRVAGVGRTEGGGFPPFALAGSNYGKEPEDAVLICRFDGAALRKEAVLPKTLGEQLVAWGDLDGDTRRDIVATGYMGGWESPAEAALAVWSLKDDALAKVTELRWKRPVFSMAVGDFDNDGKDELAVSESVREIALFVLHGGRLEEDPEARVAVTEHGGSEGEYPVLTRRGLGEGKGDELVILDLIGNRLLHTRLSHGAFTVPETLAELPDGWVGSGIQAVDTGAPGGEQALVVRVSRYDSDIRRTEEKYILFQ